jgi:hypothetical protein
LGKYYTPEFSQLTLPPGMTLSTKQRESLEVEMIKEYNKQVENRPKLYGSKDEVAKEKDYEQWHADTDPEKLWQAIERMHKVDSSSNVDEVKSMAARKAYQTIKQGSFETLAQYSEHFRETYRAFQDSTTNDVTVEDKDQAMDFFYGLDPVKYGVFKMNMIKGWTMGAFKPPSTVNEIYCIAGNWVKLTSKLEGRTSATYVTIEEHTAIKRRKEQAEKTRARQRQMESSQKTMEKKTRRTEPSSNAGTAKKKAIFLASVQRRRKTRRVKTTKA